MGRERPVGDGSGDVGAERRYGRVVIVIVEVDVEGDRRPAAGSALSVSVRDTSRADAPSVVVASATAEVLGRHGRWLATVEIVVPPSVRADRLDVRAHVAGTGARTGADDVVVGDFVSTRSYPLPEGDGEVRLAVSVKAV